MTVTEGLRVLSPAAGAGIYAAFGGPVLAVFDIGTFAVAVLLLLLTVRVVESEPERGAREPFLQEVTGGFRHLRDVPLLARLVDTLAATVAATGLADSALYGAVGHIGRPAAFVGVLLSVPGGGSAIGGMAARACRWFGEARTTGLALAVIAAGVLAWLAPSVPTFLLAALVEGIGIPIAFVALGTATQLDTPAPLQGRVSAAANLFISGPQTVFIVVGAGLIAVLDYRVLFAAIAVVSAGCSLPLLLRPGTPPPVVPSLADTATPADLGQSAVG